MFRIPALLILFQIKRIIFQSAKADDSIIFQDR